MARSSLFSIATVGNRRRNNRRRGWYGRRRRRYYRRFRRGGCYSGRRDTSRSWSDC